MKAEGAGRQRTFWEVILPVDATTKKRSQVITEQLMNDLNKQLENIQIRSTKDHRLITPWLRTTRWHEYMANRHQSTDELCRSIMLPQPNEPDNKDLHDIVQEYFQQALDLIETTDELVLQRLNSPDPIKR